MSSREIDANGLDACALLQHLARDGMNPLVEIGNARTVNHLQATSLTGPTPPPSSLLFRRENHTPPGPHNSGGDETLGSLL